MNKSRNNHKSRNHTKNCSVGKLIFPPFDPFTRGERLFIRDTSLIPQIKIYERRYRIYTDIPVLPSIEKEICYE